MASRYRLDANASRRHVLITQLQDRLVWEMYIVGMHGLSSYMWILMNLEQVNILDMLVIDLNVCMNKY